MHYYLPDETALHAFLQTEALDIDVFVHEAGFYCIIVKK
jgi:hypothetical protein